MSGLSSQQINEGNENLEEIMGRYVDLLNSEPEAEEKKAKEKKAKERKAKEGVQESSLSNLKKMQASSSPSSVGASTSKALVSTAVKPRTMAPTPTALTTKRNSRSDLNSPLQKQGRRSNNSPKSANVTAVKVSSTVTPFTVAARGSQKTGISTAEAESNANLYLLRDRTNPKRDHQAEQCEQLKQQRESKEARKKEKEKIDAEEAKKKEELRLEREEAKKKETQRLEADEAIKTATDLLKAEEASKILASMKTSGATKGKEVMEVEEGMKTFEGSNGGEHLSLPSSENQQDVNGNEGDGSHNQGKLLTSRFAHTDDSDDDEVNPKRKSGRRVLTIESDTDEDASEYESVESEREIRGCDFILGSEDMTESDNSYESSSAELSSYSDLFNFVISTSQELAFNKLVTGAVATDNKDESDEEDEEDDLNDNNGDENDDVNEESEGSPMQNIQDTENPTTEEIVNFFTVITQPMTVLFQSNVGSFTDNPSPDYVAVYFVQKYRDLSQSIYQFEYRTPDKKLIEKNGNFFQVVNEVDILHEVKLALMLFFRILWRLHVEHQSLHPTPGKVLRFPSYLFTVGNLLDTTVELQPRDVAHLVEGKCLYTLIIAGLKFSLATFDKCGSYANVPRQRMELRDRFYEMYTIGGYKEKFKATSWISTDVENAYQDYMKQKP